MNYKNNNEYVIDQVRPKTPASIVEAIATQLDRLDEAKPRE